jgi:hypothetical protein
VNVAAVCDGYKNCEDGSDEMYCGITLCAETEVMCADGRWCVPRAQWFDGVEDCMDASDEWGPVQGEPCLGFLCTSGQCIPSTRHIDGFPDCDDAGDEADYMLSYAAVAAQEFTCKDPAAVPCNRSASSVSMNSTGVCMTQTDMEASIPVGKLNISLTVGNTTVQLGSNVRLVIVCRSVKCVMVSVTVRMGPMKPTAQLLPVQTCLLVVWKVYVFIHLKCVMVSFNVSYLGMMRSTVGLSYAPARHAAQIIITPWNFPSCRITYVLLT